MQDQSQVLNMVKVRRFLRTYKTFYLFTHSHVDHSTDLSSFVKGGYFTSKNANLPLYGPAANDLKPSTSNYLHNLMSDKS